MPSSNTNTELNRTNGKRFGLEPGPERYPVGRDPAKMTAAELKMVGHFPKPLLSVIREHCVDCRGGALGEVRKCVAVACPSWPYRLAKNPWVRPSPAQRRQRAAALELAANKKIVRAAGPKISEKGPGVAECPDTPSREKNAPKPVEAKEMPSETSGGLSFLLETS